MRLTTLWGILALGGCTDGGDLGGQSGTAQPPGCVEDSREPVGDLSVPAEGFAFSVQERLDEIVGVWQGEAEIAGGDLATVIVEAAWDGEPVEAVLSHMEEGDPGDGPLPGGLPAGDCGPMYEVGFTLELVAEPWIGAAGSHRIGLVADQAPEIAIEVDESEVTGSLSPPVWDNPEFWDRTSLAAAFRAFDGSGTLFVQWWAINDDPEQSSGTGTGGEGTGVIEPSGTSSPIANVRDMVRVP